MRRVSERRRESTHEGDDRPVGQPLLARHELVPEHARQHDAPARPVENAGHHDRDADEAVPGALLSVRFGGEVRSTYR